MTQNTTSSFRNRRTVAASIATVTPPTFRKLALVSAVTLALTVGWAATDAQAQAQGQGQGQGQSQGQGQGQAGARWAEGRVLVQFRAGLPQKEKDKILKAQNGRALGRIEQIGVHIIQAPPKAEEAVTRALARNPHVKFAEKDMLFEPGLTPNDPRYSSAWHLPKIGAPIAWDWNPTMGGSITIAILDTGVDSTHPDLAGQMVPGWNFYDDNADTSDPHGHGTWVAGTAAATTNNGTGVASVAGQARIMPVRIADPSPFKVGKHSLASAGTGF